jgi:hypothetical protein
VLKLFFDLLDCQPKLPIGETMNARGIGKTTAATADLSSRQSRLMREELKRTRSQEVKHKFDGEIRVTREDHSGAFFKPSPRPVFSQFVDPASTSLDARVGAVKEAAAAGDLQSW